MSCAQVETSPVLHAGSHREAVLTARRNRSFARQVLEKTEIQLQGTNPKKRLFFNTYLISLTLVPDFVTLEFAFVRRGEPIDQFFCITTNELIQGQKESFLKFLRTFGSDIKRSERPEFPAYVRPEESEICDFMGLARHGNLGEIAIHSFSWKVALDTGQKNEKIRPTADFVGLLGCPLFLLGSFIKDLYDDSNLKGKDQRSR